MQRIHRHILVALLLFLYAALVYGLTNQFPLRRPVPLPRFAFESRIGLHPWTTWVYLSYYLLLPYAVGRSLRQEWFPRAAAAVAGVITVSGLVFVLFPTTMLRESIPPGLSGDWLLAWVRRVDPPNNCFPSLHVGLALACSLPILLWRRREGLLLLLWTGAIAVSTLTTQQHYLADVLGGLALAALSAGISFRPGRGARSGS